MHKVEQEIVSRLAQPRLQADQINLAKTRLQINELLRRFTQIEWWGQADELLAGDADFAREVREWYRDFSRIEPVDASPIAVAEAQEFFYALQVYGM